MKKILVLAALITAQLAGPLAAHAESAPSQQVRVSTDGLDLRNAADAAAMIQRIEAAVRPICVAPASGYRTTAGCIRKATRDAVESLRMPELTLVFERRASPNRPVSQS